MSKATDAVQKAIFHYESVLKDRHRDGYDAQWAEEIIGGLEEALRKIEKYEALFKWVDYRN